MTAFQKTSFKGQLMKAEDQSEQSNLQATIHMLHDWVFGAGNQPFFFFPLSPPKANSREPSMVASASVPRLPSQRLSSSC